MELWDTIIRNYPYLITVIYVVLTVVVAVVVERLTTRYLRGFSRRRELPPDMENGLVLTSRLLILMGAVIAIFRVGGIPAELLVAYSALGGALVGFASTKTIGNFIAGFYVLVVRPFRVKDYVRIGSIEGIVEEVTLNYTKILTSVNTTVLISNQRVLDQDITNYRLSGSTPPLYCYSFELDFDHTLPADRLEKMFDEVIEQYVERLPRKPEYTMIRLTSFSRYYRFYLYAESPREIFTLQPALTKNITEAWDKALSKTSKSSPS